MVDSVENQSAQSNPLAPYPDSAEDIEDSQAIAQKELQKASAAALKRYEEQLAEKLKVISDLNKSKNTMQNTLNDFRVSLDKKNKMEQELRKASDKLLREKMQEITKLNGLIKEAVEEHQVQYLDKVVGEARGLP